eukprot:15457823-Alexandrium_andersonii.AAC.1
MPHRVHERQIQVAAPRLQEVEQREADAEQLLVVREKVGDEAAQCRPWARVRDHIPRSPKVELPSEVRAGHVPLVHGMPYGLPHRAVLQKARAWRPELWNLHPHLRQALCVGVTEQPLRHAFQSRFVLPGGQP